MQKPKLSLEAQINHMENKGITFNLVSKDDAKTFISDNSYYFKIKAFAKNFPKNSYSKYVNLDFGLLQELSTLDLHLRKAILFISLNIEHAIKTKLNKHFCSNAAEDGYSIVQSFRATIKNKYTDIKSNKYTQSLINKYNPDYAIWNYLEIISLGTLCDFYHYYYNIYDKNEIKLDPFLYSVRIIRNISAHNNCLLNSIGKSFINFTVNKRLSSFISNSKYFSKNQIDKLKIPIIHDFAALLYTFNYFVSNDKMIKHTYDDLRTFISRLKRNIAYFDKHLNIKNNLLFLEKLVDFFESLAYNTITEQKS